MASEFVRPAVETEVLVDGKVRPDIDWLTITRSTGGRGDRAVLVSKEPDIVESHRLVSTAQAAGGVAAVAVGSAQQGKSLVRPAEIEIRIKSRQSPGAVAGIGGVAGAAGGQKGAVLFWGFVSGQTLHMGSDEKIVIEAGVSPFHFGDPIRGMEEAVGGGDAVYLNSVGHGNDRGRNAIVFNPYVNYRVSGNMNRKRKGKGGEYRFIDDDSLRTENARQHQGFAETSDSDFEGKSQKRLWTLTETVLALCWMCNASQQWIKNPSREQLERELAIVPISPAATQGAGGVAAAALSRSQNEVLGAELIRNVQIPLGTYLPDALDMVLNPLGYSWCIDLEPGKRSLRFWKRGEGDTQEIVLQRSRSQLDPEKSEAVEVNLQVGYASLVNQCRVLGLPNALEVTLELDQAWDPDIDPESGDFTDYALSGPKYDLNEANKRVLRDYVVGEAEDYPHINRNGIETLHEAFKRHRPASQKKMPIQARRRRFYPCLTLSADGTPIGGNGYVIEYDASQLLNEGAAAGGGAQWRPISEIGLAGQISILHEELGIRFDGHVPPEQKLKLRITATVFDDARIEAVAERKSSSPQTAVVEQMLLDPRRFQYAEVDESSIHSGVQGVRVERVDDRRAAQRMAERMRDAGDQADVSGQIELSGLVGTPYKLGDLVTGFAARGIDFSARGGGKPVYPQITQISMNNRTQRRTIYMETQRG